jgi:sulfur-oxidizing protein SoxZ
MADEDSGRIRARVHDGVVTVKVILVHPMETGARKDRTKGNPVPRHFIREVVCEHNGKPVLTMDWGWGVSTNPYLSFDLKEGKAGDLVSVRWVDNRGETGRVEGEVS